MELSFCYNWEAEFGPISELMNPLFEAHSEVADALLAFLDPVDSPLLPIDTIFKKEGGDSFSSLSPPSSATMQSLPQTQSDEFYLDSCPKRHRSCSDHYAAPPPPIYQSSPFFQPTIPTHWDFEVPALPPTTVAPFSTTAGSLSLQSAAARERRKRISEKTQELSRLVPGGSKMNTAEMLQAAHKYVRFLQAQVGILGLMDPCLECKSAERGHLQVLLASPTIQERLAAEEKCIVPKEMVTELAADPQLKSRPFIAKSMDQLIQSTIRTTDYSK